MRFLATLLILFLAQSQANVQGVVVDDDTGQPLSGVVVNLSTAQAMTDEEGRFTLTAAERGRFRIVPTKSGYVFVRNDHAIVEPGVPVDVLPETRIQNLQLRMAKAAVIRGKVLDAAGKPVLVGSAGSVILSRYSYGTEGRRGLGPVPGLKYGGAGTSSLRMNDQGEFRFYDLQPGEYYLSVSGRLVPIGDPDGGFCYPGVTSAARARPITVRSGEDINIGVLTVPQRVEGLALKLRFDEAEASFRGSPTVYFANSVMRVPSAEPRELTIPSVAPGKYRVVLTDTVGLFGASSITYAIADVELSSVNVSQTVAVKQGVALKTRIFLESVAGERIPTTQSMGCQLRTPFVAVTASCTSPQIVPFDYQIEFGRLPADAYVVSARSAEHDVTREGLHVTGDTELEIVLSNNGAIAQGVVKNKNGVPLADATVAVIPKDSLRGTGMFFRTGITNHEGKYEIHGIAPGEYKLFAWTALEGAAYRNAEFMAAYEERGKPVRLEKAEKVSMDLETLN